MGADQPLPRHCSPISDLPQQAQRGCDRPRLMGLQAYGWLSWQLEHSALFAKAALSSICITLRATVKTSCLAFSCCPWELLHELMDRSPRLAEDSDDFCKSAKQPSLLARLDSRLDDLDWNLPISMS